MPAEELIFEYSRQISPAASPAGVVHYFTNDAQIFAIDTHLQKYEHIQVANGDWSNFEALTVMQDSPDDFESLRLDHPAFGAVFGITDNMMFHLYVYAADLSDLVDTSEITEQADNQIKGLMLNLKNTGNAFFESRNSMFQPGSKLTMATTLGDYDDYYEMGTYYLDRVPFDPFAAIMNFQGRSLAGRLKDANFDLFNSPNSAVFTGTCGQISIDVLIQYSDGQIAAGDIITNLVTELTATFQPSEKVLDGFNKWLSSIGWAMVELYDGRYVIGPPVELISLHRPTNRYTFTKNQDVFTRTIEKSGDGAYSRVGVKYGNPEAYVYATIPTYDNWFIPTHKTLYIDALEGSDAIQAQALADNKANEMQYVGTKEQCFGPFRPWLLVGDIAQLSENGIITVLGTITEVKHQMGAQGFFTSFVVDSGGKILNESGGDLTVAVTSINGANRMRRITDFISKQ